MFFALGVGFAEQKKHAPWLASSQNGFAAPPTNIAFVESE